MPLKTHVTGSVLIYVMYHIKNNNSKIVKILFKKIKNGGAPLD